MAKRAKILRQNTTLRKTHERHLADLTCNLMALESALGPKCPAFQSTELLQHSVTGNSIAAADKSLINTIYKPKYARYHINFLRLQNHRFLRQLLSLIPKQSMRDKFILHKVDVTKGAQRIGSVVFIPGKFTLHYSLKRPSSAAAPALPSADFLRADVPLITYPGEAGPDEACPDSHRPAKRPAKRPTKGAKRKPQRPTSIIAIADYISDTRLKLPKNITAKIKVMNGIFDLLLQDIPYLTPKLRKKRF